MKPLKYPLDLNENNVDYVSFTHFKYKTNRNIRTKAVNSEDRSGLESFGDDLGSGEGDADPPQDPGSRRIHLYMPNSTPGMNTGQSWADQNLAGPLGQLRLDLASQTAGTISSGLTTLRSGNGGAQIANDILKDLGLAGGQIINSVMENGIDAAEQYAIEAISEGFLQNKNAYMSLNQGKIYNSNIEVIYNGPRLRSFNMTFLMIPKDDQEATAITEIIKEFKIWSAPNENANYYELPHVWRVEYKTPLKNSMNVFKRSILTDVAVQQNPGQTTHMTFDDGYPISTTITLSFKEVDVITRKDQINARGIGF